MKNILVPTDFSNTAYNALFHATKLMEGKPCNFYILNVYNGFTPIQKRIPGKEESELRQEESSEGLKSVCHRIRLDDAEGQHNFEIHSKRGNLLNEISNIFDQEEIDLIVMGNKGRSEIEAIFMGSNTLDVITKFKQCPILVIPKEIDFKPLKKIAFVTDYKRSYDAGLLRPLIFMAECYQSKIHIMHVNEEEKLDKHQTANKNLLMEYFSPFSYVFHWMPLFKSKTTAINVFLDELPVDILVMVNYEHSFLERMTREPVIKRIGFNNTIPFLVIPYED